MDAVKRFLLVRKILVFVFALLVVERIAAQNLPYHPFPDSSAQWNEVSCYLGNGAEEKKGYVFTIAGDTFINGLNYSLIGNGCTFLDAGNVPFQFPGDVIFAIREDSAKKIWLRWLSSPYLWCRCHELFYIPPLDSDVLLYDFGMQIGDTAQWIVPFEKTLLRIDSVQLLSGEWRRTFLFDTTGNSQVQYWIEGIGSSWGLLGPYCEYPFEGHCDISCFTQNDTTLIDNVSSLWCPLFQLTSCNSIYVSSADIDMEEHDISFFPNPTVSLLHFTLPRLSGGQASNETIQQIIISTSDGRVAEVLDASSFQLNNEIDVSHLNAGFYLLQIKTATSATPADRQVFLSRFIKI